MLNELIDKTEIGQSAIISMAAAALGVFLLPLVFVFLWKKRCGKDTSFKYLFIGAAGFVVSALVLEQGLHAVCIAADNPVSRFINGNTAAYAIYGAFAAGIFEECGRYIIMRFILKKNITRENALMYGIGHGGIEVWAVVMSSLISALVIAVTLKNGGADGLAQLLGTSGELSGSLLEQVSAVVSYAAGYNALTAFFSVFERLGAMFIHIGLTVVVACGVQKSEIKYLFEAVLAHAAVDFPVALYQRGVVDQIPIEIWFVVCAVLIALWGRKLYRGMQGGNL